MSIGSLLKRVRDALPVILAAAPGVIDAIRQVREALKKPKKPAAAGADLLGAGGPAPRRLSADSERGAR